MHVCAQHRLGCHYSASVQRSFLALLSQVTLHCAVFLGTLSRLGLERASGGGPGELRWLCLAPCKGGLLRVLQNTSLPWKAVAEALAVLSCLDSLRDIRMTVLVMMTP